MASRTYDITRKNATPSVVNRGTSGGDSYYVSEVTTLAGGGIRNETYRTDGAGNNRVLIRTIDVSNLGEITKNETSSNATIDEQRDFLNKGSTLNRLIKSQVNELRTDLRVEIDSTGANINVISDQIFEIAAGGSGNTSIETGEEYSNLPGKDDSGDANDGGGSLPLTEFEIDRLEVKARDRQIKYENLFYPEDIATNKQDRIVFKMFYQSGRDIDFSLERGDNLFTFGKRNITNILGSVTLPIQSGIEDSNTVSYQDGTLNPVIGALASVALDPFQAATEALSLLNQDVEDLQKSLNTPASKNVINVLRTYLAQTAVGAQGLIPRTTGAILNPNIELLLKAPNLRSFTFNFRMSARSRTEAQQIKKIIRFFKQGMSVKRSTSSLFILTPNLFKIKYLTSNGTQHPSIGRIKNCALTAINTQYTPDGTYMTFDDEERTMTSYNIQMQFKELEPLTETDYHTGPIDDDPIFTNDNQIGY